MFKTGKVVVILLVLLISGCFRLEGTPSPPSKSYTLEYPSPSFQGMEKTGATIKVERLSTVQAFNRFAMVYRPEPFRYASYYYDRWIANPGEMMTYLLTRDMRASGLFGAVFSYRDPDAARFRIEGEVMEFFEDDEGEPAAVIRLDATLYDLGSGEEQGKVVFQRSYRFTEPCAKTADGLAKGMSKAMAALSEKLILDVYNSARRVTADFPV